MDHRYLIVAGEPELLDEYLCEMADTDRHGHDAAIRPVVRVLRMLRYPAQRAIIWPDVATDNAPLPGLCLARLRVLREAGPSDLAALETCCDYAASVRKCALAAIREARSEAERMAIALQLAGRRGMRRSTYILTELEAIQLEADTGVRL